MIDVKDYCFNLVKGDLFSANEDVSLAHCVSEDFVMSRGIATEFKKRFGNVDVLLEQSELFFYLLLIFQRFIANLFKSGFITLRSYKIRVNQQ